MSEEPVRCSVRRLPSVRINRIARLHVLPSPHFRRYQQRERFSSQ